MVDGDILKLYVKGTVKETQQKNATDAVVELLRPTLNVEVRVQNYPVRGLHARDSTIVLDSGLLAVDSGF